MPDPAAFDRTGIERLIGLVCPDRLSASDRNRKRDSLRQRSGPAFLGSRTWCKNAPYASTSSHPSPHMVQKCTICEHFEPNQPEYGAKMHHVTALNTDRTNPPAKTPGHRPPDRYRGPGNPVRIWCKNAPRDRAQHRSHEPGPQKRRVTVPQTDIAGPCANAKRAVRGRPFNPFTAPPRPAASVRPRAARPPCARSRRRARRARPCLRSRRRRSRTARSRAAPAAAGCPPYA